MKIITDSEKVQISDLRVLNETDAATIVAGLRSLVAQGVRTIEFDLSRFRSIDCAAVDGLLAIHDAVDHSAGFVWRVLNPPPDLRQLLELVRLHELFEITPPRVPGMAVL